ncbi:MAG: hypothetical protein GY909_16140 [Oligoflexia bacterium]|nr:hypothetical protein [Oligoflexia bacterium]
MDLDLVNKLRKKHNELDKKMSDEIKFYTLSSQNKLDIEKLLAFYEVDIVIGEILNMVSKIKVFEMDGSFYEALTLKKIKKVNYKDLIRCILVKLNRDEIPEFLYFSIWEKIRDIEVSLCGLYFQEVSSEKV